MSFYDFDRTTLKEHLRERGWSASHADTLFRRLYQIRLTPVRQELPDALEAELEGAFYKKELQKLDCVEDQDGTRKYLFRLKDGAQVESVLMFHHFGQTACISTQVGCAMGCRFCASGQLKKVRNLEVREMVEQVLYIREDLQNHPDAPPLTGLVLMGIGEPMDNYEHVIRFLRIVVDPMGLHFAPRKVDVSTSGLAPKIVDFAKEAPNGVRLSVSLHAATNACRDQLMPINHRYPIEVLMEALHAYRSIAKRRIHFEYILIDGVTDTDEQAEALIALLLPFGDDAMVNLIPYNAVDGTEFCRTPYERREAFAQRLMDGGLRVFRRQERGSGSAAACGQLRSRYLRKQTKKTEQN